MEIEKRHRIEYGLAVVWLIFTISLTGWWMIFGLRQADTLRQVDQKRSDKLARVHHMLFWEGGALIASLIAGGSALLYGIHRERKRHSAVEEFFAAFTHELRTSLASLRLQVESLQEDLLEKGEHTPLLDRLLKDSVRLQLQLDNSLFYANRRKGKLYIERLSLRRMVESIALEFSDLHVRIEGEATVLADARALESVLRNLFQNALVHGHATAIDIRISAPEGANVAVVIEDDGKGPAVDPSELGRLFYRPTSASGTGVGLYISRQLVHRMNGLLALSRGSRGLVATLQLPEARS
ncbi:MAG: HAMP domain-containing sensor histidine kinase [Acidobacteriota bacterium]